MLMLSFVDPPDNLSLRGRPGDLPDEFDIKVGRRLSTLTKAAAQADLELVQAVLRKDRKATAELVRVYSDPVYRYVRFRLHPRVEAVEDLVQEVFLTAWKSLERYGGEAPLRAWLLGIARHKVQDHYRQMLRQASLPEDVEEWEETGETMEALVMGQQAQGRVMEVLAELPEDYRLVLLWRYWEQQSAEVMAAETGRSSKAVERLLARARGKFKEIWQRKEAQA